RIRQGRQFDIIERICGGVEKIARIVQDREHGNPRIGVVDAEHQPVPVEVALERHRIEAAVLALGRLRPGYVVFGKPVADAGLAAGGYRTNLLRLEAVLMVTLDGEFLVLVAERQQSAVNRARAVVLEVAEVEGRAAAILLVLELAIEAANVELGGFAEAEVEVQRAADPLPLDVVVAVLESRGEGARSGVGPVVRLDVVGFELALVVRRTARDANVVGQAECEIEAALGRQFAGIVVVAAFEFYAEMVAAAIEGAGGVDLYRGADRVGIHVGGQRLLHFDRFDDVAGDHVERDRAHVGFRRRQAYAVDRTRHELGIEAAHRNEAAFALVIENVDAR